MPVETGATTPDNDPDNGVFHQINDEEPNRTGVDVNANVNVNVNAHTPELQAINIDSITSQMKSSPNTWRSDDVNLSSSNNNRKNHHQHADPNSTALMTPQHCCLKRIDISEKPFGEDNDHDHDDTNRQDRLNAEKTDLIPGYYEGGLKVWECSIDLCEHLLDLILEMSASMVDNDLSAALRSTGSTLELGCGHALPACVILRELRRRSRPRDSIDMGMDMDMNINMDTNMKICHDSISTRTGDDSRPIVVFTDYNHFVLKDVTLPNIILNCASNLSSNTGENQEHILPLNQCCSLVAGDWLELSKRLRENKMITDVNNKEESAESNFPKDGRFDLILAAETTYTESSANDTAFLLMNHLKMEGGVGFIATKRYYFGVGGGSDAFLDSAARQTLTVDGTVYHLKVEKVRDFNDGKSNIRDLWRVKSARGPITTIN